MTFTRPAIIRLYTPRSIWGELICLFTNSRFSHATIEINGVMYDSSEKRGSFDVSLIDNKTREYTQYTIWCKDLSPWVKSMEGKKYDWVGVFGWIFGCNDRSKFYCFETIYSALVYAGLTEPTDKPVSANTIISVLAKSLYHKEK